MSKELLLSTEAQEMLSALFIKAIDLLPYANDEACNHLFANVAQFCQGALTKKNERKQAKFASLDVEELIALAKQFEEGQNKDVNNIKANVSPSNKRIRESEQKEELSPHQSESKRSITKWEFSNAYNIIEVIEVQKDPFQISVKARPPIAGNQKPLPYYMDENDFNSVQDQKGRSGTKLRTKITEALEAYCNAQEYPAVLIEKLKQFEWGQKLCEKLQLK